jgi:hypothetical protein
MRMAGGGIAYVAFAAFRLPAPPALDLAGRVVDCRSRAVKRHREASELSAENANRFDLFRAPKSGVVSCRQECSVR